MHWQTTQQRLHRKEMTAHVGHRNTAAAAVVAVSAELSEQDPRLLLRQNPTVSSRCRDEIPLGRLSFVPIEALFMQSTAEDIETMLPLSLDCGV